MGTGPNIWVAPPNGGPPEKGVLFDIDQLVIKMGADPLPGIVDIPLVAATPESPHLIEEGRLLSGRPILKRGQPNEIALRGDWNGLFLFMPPPVLVDFADIEPLAEGLRFWAGVESRHPPFARVGKADELERYEVFTIENNAKIMWLDRKNAIRVDTCYRGNLVSRPAKHGEVVDYLFDRGMRRAMEENATGVAWALENLIALGAKNETDRLDRTCPTLLNPGVRERLFGRR